MDEVAEQQGVRPGTVHNWVRLGKLRALKCREGKRRIVEEDLQAYREGRPPPQRPEEQEKAADSKQEDRVRDAEAARKWKEAADYIGDLVKAARHVNDFAELALREAERRCREFHPEAAHAGLKRTDRVGRGEWGRANRWTDPWSAPPWTSDW